MPEPTRCGRIMIGSGEDSWDPTCDLFDGHDGPCKSLSARDQNRVRPLNYPLTGFKVGLLSALDGRGYRAFHNIGAHKAHKRRALRELHEMGLVRSSMHDEWSITPKGTAVVDADREHDGTSAERLRFAQWVASVWAHGGRHA